MKNQKSIHSTSSGQEIKNQILESQIKFNSQLTTHNTQLNHAFTIVELLISVAIISILMSVSFAGYAKLNQRQIVISAGQNLKNIIRDAQSRVLNNEIDCSICSCPTPGAGSASFNGWTVDFANRQIYGSCGATPTVFSAIPFNLASAIIITPHVTPVTQLIFQNNPLSVSSKATICVTSQDVSPDYYIIRVAQTGSVSDDGGLVSSCTP